MSSSFRIAVKLSIALIILLASVVPANHALAYNPFKKACNVPGTGSADPCQPQNSILGPDGVMMTVTNAVAVLAGIAAVIIIIIGGIQMVTSGGDANKSANGRKAVIYAVVGLIVIAISRSIVAFVINSIL